MIRFLLPLALLLQEAAPEKVEIKFQPAQGDKIETFSTWSHTFRGKLGEEPIDYSTRGGQRMISEFAAVEKGAVTKKGVDVVDSYLEQQDVRTHKYVRSDDPMHGRKVTVELKGGKEERTGVDGVPEHQAKTVALVDPLTRLFPAGPKAVGDSWEISGEGLKLIFAGGDFTEGTITVSLRDIKVVDGRKCAFLGTNYHVKGVAGGITRELKLLGTMTVWIDRGYILAMSQSGRMTTSGADEKSGHPNGEGVITGELKTTFPEKKP
jgi:hypothetical protein